MAELAARQHGVVAAWQLRPLGITRRMIERRLENGRLYRVFRGVYALTPHTLPRGRFMAAALSYGPDAALSHRAAAAMWEIGPWPSGPIDVTLKEKRKAQPGIRLHRATVERREVDGFPVTTPTRTLIDLSSLLPLARLGEAFERAERLGLLDVKAITEEMQGKRGARNIRKVLGDLGAEPDRSELERAFRKLCKTHNLLLPSLNVAVHGHDVDAHWPGTKVVVELDSWEWHRTRKAFERDRAKAASLERKGIRVLRFTWRQLTREAAATAATVRTALAAATDQ